jgi:hypothetical protein
MLRSTSKYFKYFVVILEAEVLLPRHVQDKTRKNEDSASFRDDDKDETTTTTCVCVKAVLVFEKRLDIILI